MDNAKFKNAFHTKAKMLTPEEVVDLVGHAVGGVCPFAIKEDVAVYLDCSMKRFPSVFPAAGSANSAIELTCDQLEQYAQNVQGWGGLLQGVAGGGLSTPVRLQEIPETAENRVQKGGAFAGIPLSFCPSAEQISNHQALPQPPVACLSPPEMVQWPRGDDMETKDVILQLRIQNGWTRRNSRKNCV